MLRNRTNIPTRPQEMLSKPVGIPAKAIGRLGITTPAKVFCEQTTAEQYRNEAKEAFEVNLDS